MGIAMCVVFVSGPIITRSDIFGRLTTIRLGTENQPNSKALMWVLRQRLCLIETIVNALKTP